MQISFLTPPFAYSIFYLKGINVGLELPEMTAETQERLRAEMTPFAPPPVNPIDSIGRKGNTSYLNIIEIAASQEYSGKVHIVIILGINA